MRRLVSIALAGALALVAACGDDDGATPAATTSTATSIAPTTTIALTTTTRPVPAEPDGLRATVGRTRLYDVRHQFDLLLANSGPDPVSVGTIQLDSSLFDPAPPQTRDTVVLPGVTELSMPLDFGPPRCDARPGEDFVRIGAGGEERRVRASVVPGNALSVIWERECAAAAVFEAADVDFRDDWTMTSAETMDGYLEAAQRVPGTTLAVDELRGSVVFAVVLDDPASPVLVVDDDHPDVRIPVTISAAGCEPHILIESKKTYVFTAYVTLDGTGATVELAIPVPERAPFDELLEPCLRTG